MKKVNVKSQFTRIYKEEYFKKILVKLTLNQQLDSNEAEYVLSLSLIFYDWYIKKDQDYYFEFSYYLILKYSFITEDYRPLYEFSTNVGFYPITKLIVEKNFDSAGILDIIVTSGLEKFEVDKIMETKEQYESKKTLIESNRKYKSFIAPTSYGKSTLIVKDILKEKQNKIGIIVPKKALIWETYRRMKEMSAKNGYQLLIHDTEYDGEDKFIGIFTQERALRLLQDNDIYFDVLYIDEAHNLFEKDDRNILLARLIRLNKKINPSHKIIFLSPLIENSNNLMLEKNMEIEEQRINFNIKEPNIHYYETNGEERVYNRFINDYIFIERHDNGWEEYIVKKTVNKSLLYVYRPKHVQELALYFNKSLPTINSDKLNEIALILEKYVYEDYFMVELVKKGVIFLHGKVPDGIRDYLIQKFKVVDELKYLVSNSTVLEGVNFPIDSLFIFNVHSLNKNNLNNLIGRVNRLNEIFIETKNLKRLISPIHFVKTDQFGGSESFQNKIELLRVLEVEDVVQNPILINTKNPNEKTVEKEQSYLDNFMDKSIESILLKNNIDVFYKDFKSTQTKIYKNLQKINEKSKDKNIIILIKDIFFDNFTYEDFVDDEIARFVNIETIDFYHYYIKNIHHSNLKAKVVYFLNHFRYKSGKGELFFIGKSFGEVAKQTSLHPFSTRKTYIDVSTKSEKEKINFAIIKAMIEDDVINFKISRFVKALLDLSIISQESYDKFLYNTSDQQKINLIKFGFSTHLINFIEENNLHSEIEKTERGFIVTKKFIEIVSKEDDFIKFEINKLIDN